MSLELQLLCAVLATWRLAHLLAHEDGPFDVIFKLRRRAGSGVFGQWMDCPYCSSFWIALPFAFWPSVDWVSRVIFWLAISGGACALQRYAPAQTRPASNTTNAGEKP